MSALINPETGKRIKTGGRAKGTVNKATADIRAAAQVHGPAVIRRLAVLSDVLPKKALRKGEKPAQLEQTQVMAMRELLNRGYGYATQPIAHSADESFEAILDRLERVTRLSTGRPPPVLLGEAREIVQDIEDQETLIDRLTDDR